jgi:hypothetical protein
MDTRLESLELFILLRVLLRALGIPERRLSTVAARIAEVIAEEVQP